MHVPLKCDIRGVTAILERIDSRPHRVLRAIIDQGYVNSRSMVAHTRRRGHLAYVCLVPFTTISFGHVLGYEGASVWRIAEGWVARRRASRGSFITVIVRLTSPLTTPPLCLFSTLLLFCWKKRKREMRQSTKPAGHSITAFYSVILYRAGRQSLSNGTPEIDRFSEDPEFYITRSDPAIFGTVR